MRHWLIFILTLACIIQCQNKDVDNQKEYFQTFDEFKSAGVNSLTIIDDLKQFVVIDRRLNSILLTVHDRGSTDSILYVNSKKGYWYYTKIDTFRQGEFYKEVYLFNDTIMRFEYTNVEGNIINETLSFITSNEDLVFCDEDFESLTGDYNGCKEILKKASDYSYKNSQSQKKWFESFSKEIINDTLFVYENKGAVGELGCLVNACLLDDLGVFRINKNNGISLSEIKFNHNCK